MGDEDGGGLKIVKIGSTTPAPKKAASAKSRRQQHHDKKPKFGVLKGGKTARSKPRFEGVRDPAKAPPMKKSSRLRILTEKGVATRRAAIANEAKRRPISEIRKTLRNNKMNVDEKTPEHLARKIYEDAQEAGMISSV